ncbi:hypothetical protein [Halomonas sp.]|uniref:hypothetical protein n=1 Tax=Halomonas sp. TaxID=1486246 RepID=UPI00298E26EE|nr:hypothetical protein [Halomonas sp.]MDW7747020.1 hypothetical protein [Halomonas sp.]
MKIIVGYIFLGVIFIASGCTTIIGTDTDFSRWTGSDTYSGNGGLLDEHEGVEFWRAGAPEREFSIVGIITQNKRSSTMHDAMFGNVNRGEIISIVMNNNADGVITTDSQRYISGYTTTIPQSIPSSANTKAKIRENSAMIVFKYVK